MRAGALLTVVYGLRDGDGQIAADLRVSWFCDGAPIDVGVADAAYLLHDTEHRVLDIRQQLVSLALAATTASSPADA